MSENREYRNKRVLYGVVVSKVGDKTIGVKVERLKQHRRYKKYIKVSRKFFAHDERNEAGIGDRVMIVESRPLSATKRWRLSRIVERSVERREGTQ